jgi:hydrogenase maturation factor
MRDGNPGLIVSIAADGEFAIVEIGSAVEVVSLAFPDQDKPVVGDWVAVANGAATQRLEEQEVRDALGAIAAAEQANPVEEGLVPRPA